MKKFMVVMLVLGAAFALGACGGSGGSSAPAVGTFSLGELSDDGSVKTTSYDVDFAAGGVLNYAMTATSSGGLESGTGAYVNNGDGSLTVDGTMRFYTSGDGELIGSLDNTGSSHSMMFGARKGSGMSVASLSGNYVLYSFLHDGAQSYTRMADVNFDGSGTAIMTNIQLSDGSPLDTGSYPSAYSVGATGAVSIAAADFSGQLASSGQAAVMVDTETSNSSELELAILVKKVAAGGAGTAPSGTYLALQMMDDEVGNGVGVRRVTAMTITIVDGTNMAVQDVFNPNEGGPATYTYDAATGAFSAGESGWLSSDGQAFAMARLDGASLENPGDSFPTVWMMVGIKL